jgi:pyruvate/2-oxoacid:ferredoxin oxidoreductase beta subunit
MSKKNPEYDFKWCPGCGDFGVRRALEFAMIDPWKRPDCPWKTMW